MPQRLFSEARAALDVVLLSPNERAEREGEIADRLMPLLDDFERFQDDAETRLTSSIAEVKRDLKRVTRDLYALDKEGKRGGISAKEYGHRFTALLSERDAIQRRAERLRAEVDEFERLDANPERSVDEQLARHPLLRPHFSF